MLKNIIIDFINLIYYLFNLFQKLTGKANARISGTILFEFDLECLYVARKAESVEKVINQKRLYNELNSKSQKNKRLVLAAKNINS